MKKAVYIIFKIITIVMVVVTGLALYLTADMIYEASMWGPAAMIPIFTFGCGILTCIFFGIESWLGVCPGRRWRRGSGTACI